MLNCIACRVPLSLKTDLPFFPICSLCSKSLLDCPSLCKNCGGPACQIECTRPWIQNPGIHSFSARYLSIQPGYSVLRKWKIRRGPFFDRQILKPSDTLFQTWREFHPDCVIPVPQSWKRSWSLRGSPAQIIANWVSRQTQTPCIEALEIPTKTGSQATLSAWSRLQNRIDFQHVLKNLIHFKRAILVDDFMTTGHTLRSACQALNSTGLKQIHVFSLGVRLNHNSK